MLTLTLGQMHKMVAKYQTDIETARQGSKETVTDIRARIERLQRQIELAEEEIAILGRSLPDDHIEI